MNPALLAKRRSGSSPQRNAGACTRSCENTLRSYYLIGIWRSKDRVDLLERKRPCTREIRDLTPENLPALIEADRLRAEEEYYRGRAEFLREAQVDLEQFVTELVRAARETRR
jgi:hypothetical protein